MAFSECAARMFTATSVLKNAPDCSGVYALSNAREWIFIGEASDIRARLLEHLNEIGTTLMARNPTGFTFEICSPADRHSRYAQLVRELAPYCNRGSLS
jgi:excinuclease UvrABC nuclease subunit